VPKSAVVLLSGGLDSAVTAWVAKNDIGKTGKLYTMLIGYGQRHFRENKSAERLSDILDVEGSVYLDLKDILYLAAGNMSSLLSQSGVVPRTEGVEKGIPSTWVPQRNSIFLALAFTYAESVGADYVYAGFNIVDYSGYPDCRPEFTEAMSKALNLASKRYVETGRGIGLITPLINKKKTDIILLGIKLNVPFQYTWSCYMGGAKACGKCDSCRIRLKAFKDVGLVDPIPYE